MLRFINKQPIIFATLFFVIIALFHKIPLDFFFEEKLLLDKPVAKMLQKLAINTLVISISIYLCVKLNLLRLGGLIFSNVKNALVYLIPLIYLIMISKYFRNIQAIGTENILSPVVVLFFFKSISVGIFEEITFRSLFQSLVIKRYYKRYGIVICISVSSALFGLGHLINLLNDNYSIIGVTSQVFMAGCIGFLLGSVIVVTQNSYPIMLLHALNHFSTFIQELFPEYFDSNKIIEHSSNLEILGSIVVTFFFFGLPTILPSIFLLKRYTNLKV